MKSKIIRNITIIRKKNQSLKIDDKASTNFS
jgi:hypothetical protein